MDSVAGGKNQKFFGNEFAPPLSPGWILFWSRMQPREEEGGSWVASWEIIGTVEKTLGITHCKIEMSS